MNRGKDGDLCSTAWLGWGCMGRMVWVMGYGGFGLGLRFNNNKAITLPA